MSDVATPRTGVIGIGAIGMIHLRAWQAIGAPPVAFAELDDDLRERVETETGVPGYRDAIDLLASGKLDIVSICTPPFTHAALVEAAIDAGLAIVCEKPLAHTVVDAERIERMVTSNRSTFTVGFCHRFQPQVEMMKAMIEAGDIGEPMLFRNRFAGHKADVESTWFANPSLSGGGPMMDTSVHSVDLYRHLMGNPIHVSALTSTRETNVGPMLDTEDTAAMLLQSAAGTIGVIETSWRTPVPEWRVVIHGTCGALELDYEALTLRHAPAGGAWAPVEVADAGASRFERELEHFVAVWRGDAEPRVTVADGVAANRILDAAYRAAAPPRRIA